MIVAYRFVGLIDAARPGRPRTVSEEQVQNVVNRALQSLPENAAQWSVRSMSAATGVSPATAQRIWSAFDLEPHLQSTFKLSSEIVFRRQGP